MDALASEGDSQSGLRRAQEFKHYLEQIIEERNANVAELHRVAELNKCIRRDVSELSREVALLQANVHDIKKAKRRRRYLAQIGQYMEAVAHARDQALATTEAFNKANDRLREKAGRLVTEKQDLLNSLAV
jgi:Asp-tRNA(Asn)/Glu-tRNA(Gln) amidotransferase C subunit